MEACEGKDAGLFSKSVQEYCKFTPFDKVLTKLVVEIKSKNCPEAATAYSAMAGVGGNKNQGGFNLIDGDTDADKE